MYTPTPKILLVNPWITDFAAYDLWIKPLGLLMTAALLERSGCRCELLDCLDRFHPALLTYPAFGGRCRPDGTGSYHKARLQKPACLQHVPRYYSRYGWPVELVEAHLRRMQKPDAVFVTSGMTYWYPGVVEMIRLLKTVFPGVPVVLGGIYATLCPEHAVSFSGADEVVTGRAENALPDLLRSLFGLHLQADPDAFPAPLYSLYPALRSAALLTSRGCPYACPFCASGLLFPGFVTRDISSVTAEIKTLAVQKGVADFAFFDDALLHRCNDHFLPLLEEITSLGLPLRFYTPNGLQPKRIDADTALLMKQAGFCTLQLSYESSSRARQADMQHKVSDADLVSAVEHLKSAGFAASDLSTYVLMGLPGQPLHEVTASLQFVFRLGIKVNLASYSPIPGTPLWDESCAAMHQTASPDPLVTNNSIFPLADREHHAHYRQLRTLVSQANTIISQSGDPFAAAGFSEMLTRLAR